MNTVDYAYNDYLQVLAETGVAGLAFAAALAALALVRALRCAPASYLALASAGALAAIAVHSLADFNLYIPANARVAAGVAGIALSPGPRP